MFLWIFCLLPACIAQEPVSIKVDVSLVNVAFIVRDGSGALASGLGKDDIEIYEDGVKQDVRFFGRSADTPLSLAVLLDVSGSQDRFIKQHNHDLERFLGAALSKRDQALAVCFGNHLRLVSDFSNSPQAVMEAVARFGKGDRHYPELDPDETRAGGTALFDAVHAVATGKLGGVAGGRQAILLFSDGEDNSSAHDLMDAIADAQNVDAPIYTVRYTEPSRHGRLTSRNRYGIKEMERLARETGGRAFDAAQQGVGESLKQVAEELRSIYDIGYVSSNPARDGSFRKVSIRVNRPGYMARSKTGYFAK